MKLDFIKSRKFKFYTLLIVLVLIASSAFYYYMYGKSGPILNREEKTYNYPVYTLLQNEEAKVVAYDYVNKKNILIFSMPYKNPGIEYGYEFYADISPDGKNIVYSTDSGIYTYNIDSKETKELIKTTKPDTTSDKMVFNESYVYPKWTFDGQKIVYTTLGYENRILNIMNVDGSNSLKIKNSSGNYVLSESSYDYVLGNYNDMGGEYGLFKKSSAGINETESILPEGINYGVSAVDYGVNENNVYFSGVKDPNQTPNQKNEIVSLNVANKSLKTILSDDNYIPSLKYNTYDHAVYFGKLVTNSSLNNGLGIFKLVPSTGVAEKFLKDGDNRLSVTGSKGEFLTFESAPPTYAPEAIKKLNLVSVKDKTPILIGEANKINFSGWINNKLIKSDADTIGAPTPTQNEIDAYTYSQKTKETLFKSFYNYCWDYDCNSKTYPYPAISVSKKPDIVTIQQKPLLLTGNVTVPIVFLQFDDKNIPDYQINAYKDESLYNSFGALAKWINAQATTYKQKLSFAFDYKDPVTLTRSDACIEYEGINKYYSSNCIKDAVNQKYPSLQNEGLVIFSLGRIYKSDLTDNYGLRNNYKLSEANISYLMNTWSIQSGGLDNKVDIPESTFRDEMDTKEQGNSWWFQSAETISNMFTVYGAQSKKATHKEPINSNAVACYAGIKNDVMCRQYLENGSYKQYAKFNDLVIGDITRKELGWYDMDGDKVNEVDEK